MENTKYTFDQALAVMCDVCRVNDNHPGYIANTIRKMFDESKLTLEQWFKLAEHSDKTKKWASQQWANHQ